ncbi:MAG: hypothetical protein HYS18_05445 [Burkholderiales bacterium]|nr:hypothetical protein [Burkholderiales bacterium]
MKKIVLSGLAAIGAALALLACGGGGSEASSSTAITTTTTTTITATTTTTTNSTNNTGTSTISGSAVKGPVANATVTVKNASTGAILATTTTNSLGAYTIDVSYTGDVIVEISGGTYTDEATGVLMNLSTPLKVVLNANGSVTGMVTPLTTMAYTSAFGSASSAVTSTAFNTAASQIATQFKLSGTNLATTLPTVSGSNANDYGKVLRAVSQYLQSQNVTLPTLTNLTFTSQQLPAFSVAFSSAYNTVNPGSSVTFSFDGNAFNIGGTGVGGGTGTCGVNVQGSVTAAGITVPLNLNFCITGIATGSCNSGNAQISQAISAQGGISGAANLSYSYSSTCVAGATKINLQ